MAWWIWILVALGCLALEVMTPGGIIMLFFGVSAGVVGILAAVGWAGPLWAQVVLFSVISIVSLLTLRGPIVRRMRATNAASEQVDNLVGEQAVLMQDLPPDEIGKAELRGTTWGVRNVGPEMLVKGQRCVVKKVDGVNLMVATE